MRRTAAPRPPASATASSLRPPRTARPPAAVGGREAWAAGAPSTGKPEETGTPPRGQRHEEVRAGTAPPPRPTSRPAAPTRAGAWWRGGREDRGYFGNYRWLKTRKSAKVTATSETGATS